MRPSEIAELCASCEVIVQEKLDGANVGVMVDDSGLIVCLKRAGVIGARRERAQYGYFRGWSLERADAFRRILGTRWIAYGELLWQRHTTHYTKLPDWVIFFDLFDRYLGNFACASEVADRLGCDFPIAPTVFAGRATWPFDPAELFATSLARSAFADGPSEGVVLRFERQDQLIARAKYRSPGFEPGHSGQLARNYLASP